MDKCLGVFLTPVSNAIYFNHDIEKIEKEKPASTVVFIGASRTYRTFAPKVFEDKWGVDCVVNAGTAGQNPCGTYYMLKDMMERVHPDRVYIGVTIDQLVNKAPKLQRRMIVYDRLSFKNRILMALNGLSIKEKLYLLDTYRFRDRFGLKTIRENLEEKKRIEDSDYNSYSPDKDHYSDKGFMYSYGSCKSGTIPMRGRTHFSEERIREDNLNYLDKCIELCRKNNAEVSLVTGVTSVMRMYNNADYQACDDFYNGYAAKKGIRYYNLNYLKGREQLIPDEKMSDFNHINGEGAFIISEIFADIVLKEEAGEDISQYFYKDIDEFKKDVKRIVAVNGTIEKDENDPCLLHVSIKSLQNSDVKPLYRIQIQYSGDDSFQVISDWSRKRIIDIKTDRDSGYTIKIDAAANDGSYGRASQEYRFRSKDV